MPERPANFQDLQHLGHQGKILFLPLCEGWSAPTIDEDGIHANGISWRGSQQDITEKVSGLLPDRYLANDQKFKQSIIQHMIPRYVTPSNRNADDFITLTSDLEFAIYKSTWKQACRLEAEFSSPFYIAVISTNGVRLVLPQNIFPEPSAKSISLNINDEPDEDQVMCLTKMGSKLLVYGHIPSDAIVDLIVLDPYVSGATFVSGSRHSTLDTYCTD